MFNFTNDATKAATQAGSGSLNASAAQWFVLVDSNNWVLCGPTTK
ncbi:MAG TPA: hypothetical protein VGM81_20835 [Burkholderiaceae bacterium]|jgi:hypothetical protein